MLKTSTKVSLNNITGILYGGVSITFRLRMKPLMRKMRNIREISQNVDKYSSETIKKMQKFEDMTEANDSEDGSVADDDSDFQSPERDYSDIFHSWECVSLQRKNGTTLDLCVSSI